MMLEAKPRGFSKGQAVLKILEKFPGHFPIYAGDDLTDLSVFNALGKNGLKIAVGHRLPKTSTDMRFDSPRQFLKWLKEF
jgi:trehalose 6-phosphate phosphatase